MASVLAVLVSLVPTASRALLAVEDPDPDFSLKDTVQAGLFHLAPFFVVKDFGYDDNVRLGADERSGDYTVTVGPGARGVMPLGHRAAIALWEEIDYAVFARDSDLNHVNNTFRAKTHIYLRDFIIFAHGQQESFRERPNSEIDFRIRQAATQGRFGISYRPAQRGRLDLFLNRTDHHYDAGRPEISDNTDPNLARIIGERITEALERVETNVGLDGRLKVRPRTSLLMDFQTGRIEFERTDPVRDSATVSALMGLEFDPSGPLRGTLKVGLKHLSPDDEKVDGFSGWIADSGISARIAGRGDVKATYERDINFSILGRNLFSIHDRKGLSYEHYFNRRFSIEVGRRFHDVEYPLPIQLRGSDDPKCRQRPAPAGCEARHRRDDILSDTITVRYRMGPSLRFGLSVGRWERDSTFNLEDAKRNTVTTLLEYTP